MLSEAADGVPGVADRAVAKYIIGDDADLSLNLVRFKEVGAANLAQPASDLFATVIAAIKAEEGIV